MILDVVGVQFQFFGAHTAQPWPRQPSHWPAEPSHVPGSGALSASVGAGQFELQGMTWPPQLSLRSQPGCFWK